MTAPTLVKSLKEMLLKANAHVTFKDAVRDLPAALRGVVPAHMPYSIWQLVEHIRIAQHDILDFSRNPDYKELDWPKDYWPAAAAPNNEAAWKHSIEQVDKDLHAFVDLLETSKDLFAPFPHGTGQHLFREAILLIDHNSYHVGEIVALRRLLDAWE
ncbi:DinB family protein [Chitinophaga polysaccharea]|uniref:DinB family protein n=1 Tax=Chitinophaga polysaccharea TaxID=1293035 RepID=UPI0014552599|nr:DinB family protein [Chitinophaga polysaccharea]NLR58432.1 DinB family protein [Chitinophaga polysaccharea]